MKKLLLILISVFVTEHCVFAQDVFRNLRDGWFQKAQMYKPALVKSCIKPLAIVTVIRDSSAYQAVRVVNSREPIDSIYNTSFNTRKSVIVDFGDHYTGYFTFSIKRYSGVSDSPLRLKFTFAESPAELYEKFDPYVGGLSRAWMQDEIVTPYGVPSTMTIDRRMACRYLKIELIGAPVGYDFCFSDMNFVATTSATTVVPELESTVSDKMRRINEVSLATLKECMQTVFEDGTKRDRRLWIGDLYLQSMTNNHTFKNYDLTKRCLYLLASYALDNGFLPSYAFETSRSELDPQNWACIRDYSLLYNVTLVDYLEASGDMQTALELWPVAKKQIEYAIKQLDKKSVYDKNIDPGWVFFDWKENLDTDAAIHFAFVFSLEKSYRLATLLGRQDEVRGWPELLKKIRRTGRDKFYDKSLGVVLSGADNQLSYVSQVWAILSETITAKEGAEALSLAMADSTTVDVATPYARHFLVEALIKCSMNEEALYQMNYCWGWMVDRGADTFWEVADPNNEYLSPYGFHPSNSQCHAWSCTPSYFIYKYPQVFQK